MSLSLSVEHLEFFKSLLQGESDISFRAYWIKYQDQFREALSRPQYLRLKFSPIEEIEKILKEANIEYHSNPRAIAREKYYLTFDVTVIDGQGKIKAEYLEKMFNGAISQFHAGKVDAALEKLNNYFGFPTKSVTKKLIESLQDLIYFAEIELKYGDVYLGRFLFEAIEGFKTSDERILSLKHLALKAMSEVDASNQENQRQDLSEIATAIKLKNFPVLRSKIVEILSAINEFNYDFLVDSGRAFPSSANEYRHVVNEFMRLAHGKAMTSIPENELDNVELFTRSSDKNNLYTIDIPLWIDGARSDLFAIFCVLVDRNKQIYLYDIRVM